MTTTSHLTQAVLELVTLQKPSCFVLSYFCLLSQECEWACLRGLAGLHGVVIFAVPQFAAGHLRHAGERDRHHRVWSVLALRRPGALPQASHVVRTQALPFFLFISSFIWPTCC